MAATDPGFDFWEGMTLGPVTFSAREIESGMAAVCCVRRNDAVETFPTAGWNSIQAPLHRLLYVDDATTTETTGDLYVLTGLSDSSTDRYFSSGCM